MVFRVPGRIERLLFAAMAALLFASCGKRAGEPSVKAVYDADKILVKQKGGIAYVDGKPLHGLVFRCSAAGDTLMRGAYRNGKEEGEHKSWYENGRLRERRYYVGGKKEGTHFGWYENGSRRFEYQYKGDLFHGAYLEWFADGQPFRRHHFSGGHESGSQQVWYPNGKVKSNYTIRNGRRYGLLGTENCVNVSDKLGA